MPEQNLDAVRSLAPDLRTSEPRAPKTPLGGFEFGARALDKCRASLAGTVGEFKFNCPMDQQFFRATGIEASAFEAEVATGATDEQMDKWVTENASTPQS